MADPYQPVLIGAATAVLAYVVNLAGKSIDQFLLRRASKASSLIDLQSHLLASRSAYLAQVAIRNRLASEISHDLPEFSDFGYDDMFAAAFPKLPEDQKHRHGLIRAYTVKAIKPLNDAMTAWLKQDRDFKHQPDKLGLALQNLEAHLVLWQAKYDFLIPDHPERTLVYLADEEQHGVGFPTGIEDLVLARTQKRPAIFEVQPQGLI